jgi:hypothetical protein
MVPKIEVPTQKNGDAHTKKIAGPQPCYYYSAGQYYLQSNEIEIKDCRIFG